MSSDADRLARAGNYVLGMMNDAERERAEHDLVVDDAFRVAVMQVAERMHLFDVPEPGRKDDWQAVAAKLAELPQMRALPVSEALLAPAATPAQIVSRRQPVIDPPRAARLILVIAVLALVFALGYTAGRITAGRDTAAQIDP